MDEAAVLRSAQGVVGPQYRADIDGLRAVAVLAVVFYHAFPTALSGGFVGVDVFFVISGFLISRIILQQLDRDRFSFIDFYARRIRRIFPALIVVLLVCLGYALIILLPTELAQLGCDIAGGAGFVANLLLWQEAGYFDRAAASKPLLHLWSLGVEEQFYIVWPLALWAIHRAAWRGGAQGRRGQGSVQGRAPGTTGWLPWLGAVTAGSFCLNLVLAWTDPTADFYSPLTRMWELSSGALLAWANLNGVAAGCAGGGRDARDAAGRDAARAAADDGGSDARNNAVARTARGLPDDGARGARHGKARHTAGGALASAWSWASGDSGSCVGLAMIVAAALVLNPAMRFPGALALLPTAGAVLLIVAGPAALVNRKLLSNRVAVWVGAISYPLYLWHWPLISFATIIRRGRGPKPLVAAGLVAASVLLAWLTWRLIEQPVRRGGRPGLIAASLAGLMAAVGLLGLATWNAGGFPGRYPALPDINVARVNAAISDGFFKPTPGMRVREIDRTVIAAIGAGARGVAFVGDSLVYQYGPRVEALLRAGELRRRAFFIVGASCAPMHGVIKTGYFAHCDAMPDIARQVIRDQRIDTVVLGAFWPGYGAPDQAVERAGRRIPGGTPAALAAIDANLEDDVRALIADHRRVFLVLTPPVSERFDPQRMVSRSLTGFQVDPLVREGVPTDELAAAVAEVNARVRAVAARTGARLIDPAGDICGAGPRCAAFFADGEPKYADDKHLRPMFVAAHITVFDDLLTR